VTVFGICLSLEIWTFASCIKSEPCTLWFAL
jgi:hypothetical protein